MKFNVKRTQERTLGHSVTTMRPIYQQKPSSILIRRNNYQATARGISLPPSTLHVVVIHAVMTALLIALTTFIWRSAQRMLRSMIGSLEKWAITAESTNWKEWFENLSNRFVARMRQVSPNSSSSSSSSSTTTTSPPIVPSLGAEDNVATIPGAFGGPTAHNDVGFEFGNLIPTNVPLHPLTFVSSSVSTPVTIQSEAPTGVDLSTASPMYYPMPMPTHPTMFFIPSGEGDLLTEEMKGNARNNVIQEERARESSPSVYSVIQQMEELHRQVPREHTPYTITYPPTHPTTHQLIHPSNTKANFMRLEADKAEAELAALLLEKNASQQPTDTSSTTGISTPAVTPNIEIHNAVDDGIGIGIDALMTPATAPPTTVAGQGFETNKRERQFVSSGVMPAPPPPPPPPLQQSFVQSSSSSQTGMPHAVPSASSIQSQSVLGEYTQSQSQTQSPMPPLPLSDSAVDPLTSLRKEAEELRLAELAVLAERNMV